MLVGKVGDKTRYMGMDVSDGNIVISSDEQDIFYWGEQGLNSPYAPKTASKLNNAIAKVLKEKYAYHSSQNKTTFSVFHIRSIEKFVYESCY